jgi:hypothetical protein
MNISPKKSPQLGHLYLRSNSKPKFGASSRYITAVLDDGNGCNPYLFTERQLDEARNRAFKNPEDCLALAPEKKPWWRILG